MNNIQLHHSLRLRILSLVTIIVVSVIAVMLFYIINQLKTVGGYCYQIPLNPESINM